MEIDGFKYLFQNDNIRGILAFRQALEDDPCDSNFMALGCGYLWIHDPNSSLRHFMDEITIHPLVNGAYYEMAGVAAWASKDPLMAIDLWKNALLCEYQIGTGGLTSRLLLMFASMLRPDLLTEYESREILIEGINENGMEFWPAPIALFCLEQFDRNCLIERCKGYDDRDSEFRSWKANFYIGVSSFFRGDKAGFFRVMRETAVNHRDDNVHSPELYLARYEASI